MDKRKGQGKEQMSKKDTVTKAFMREKQQKRVRSEIPGHFKGYCYYGG